MDFHPSPYDLYRTHENLSIPTGYIGWWRYFKLNPDGTYFKDKNGNYVYEPEWICIPDPHLNRDVTNDPPKPNVRPNMIAVFECFRIGEDGHYVLDSEDRPIYDTPRWFIERDASNFTLSISDNQ